MGQGSYLTEKNRKASEALIGPYLQTALEKQGLDYISTCSPMCATPVLSC